MGLFIGLADRLGRDGAADKPRQQRHGQDVRQRLDQLDGNRHPGEAHALQPDRRRIQEAVREVYVDGLIKEYIVNLVAATREQDEVYLGASPRGSLALYRASQAHAMSG